MTTRQIGKFFLALGLIIIVLSWIIDYIGLGNGKFGAGQILEMEVGGIMILLGFFCFYHVPIREIQFSNSIKVGMDWVSDWSIDTWVVGSFFFAYFVFFLFPVFLNSHNRMWYFVDYLPTGDPIGLDIRSVLKYIRDWLVLGQSPYFDKFILYPPLALILLAPLLVVGYPASYYTITLLTLLCHTTSFLLILLLIYKKKKNSLPVLLFVISLFSYGFQFELERGQFNIIAYSLCLIAIYLYHLDDIYRYPAYFLFAMGVQLKIYPVVLIFMFVKDWRDWRSNIKRFAGIFSLNFLLLFVAGIPIFLDFLRSASDRQRFATFWDWNHSLNAFVHQLTFDGFGLFDPEKLILLGRYQDSLEKILLFILGLCLVAIIIQSSVRARNGLNPFLLSVCTILALVIPSTSNDYKLPILTIPMILLWSAIVLPENRSKRVLAIFLILIIATANWAVQFPLIVRSGFLSRNFPPLFIILIATTILNFITSWEVE